jgi:hypothetical protein
MSKNAKEYVRKLRAEAKRMEKQSDTLEARARRLASRARELGATAAYVEAGVTAGQKVEVDGVKWEVCTRWGKIALHCPDRYRRSYKEAPFLRAYLDGKSISPFFMKTAEEAIAEKKAKRASILATRKLADVKYRIVKALDAETKKPIFFVERKRNYSSRFGYVARFDTLKKAENELSRIEAEFRGEAKPNG